MFAVGDRVRVKLHPWYQHAHESETVQTDGATGTVMVIFERDDHPIGVWLDLWWMGTQWTDSFNADELELLTPPVEARRTAP